MKLTCAVETSDRQLPSFCSGPKRKACHSLLSIGYEPGKPNEPGNLALLVCTSSNKTGTKYKIHGNVENVFAKFVADGKSTIRFRCPPHDLLISKADPICLKSFLKVLNGKSNNTGPTTSTTLSKLRPALASQLQVPKTRLTIMSREQFVRVQSEGGLSRTLVSLAVTDCSLSQTDLTLFKRLTALKHLDLSANQLALVPHELGRLSLERLSLARNQLDELPAQLFADALRSSLGVIDLTSNLLVRLPDNICELSRLNTLRLDTNQVSVLPCRIGGVRSLRTLTASHNQLASLPASCKMLRLHTVDVSDNPLAQNELDSPVPPNHPPNVDHCPPTLFELTCRSVIGHRIVYGVEDVPVQLARVMDAHQLCVCGRPFVHSDYPYRGQLDLKLIASTVVRSGHSTTLVPINGWLCRPTCST